MFVGQLVAAFVVQGHKASGEQAARATGARECIGRAQSVGLNWPLREDLTDEGLELLLSRRLGCRLRIAGHGRIGQESTPSCVGSG